MQKFITCFFFILIAFSQNAVADPAISYEFKNHKVIRINAIVGLEEVMSDCTQELTELTIDEVIYEGASDTIIGFRRKVSNPSTRFKTFPLNLEELNNKLPNSEKQMVNLLITKGAVVIVAYELCGNGGHVSVKDIYAKSFLNK